MSWKQIDDKKLITPEFTAAFVSVFQPKGMKGKDDSVKKYSVTMIFPKGQDFAPLEALILNVAKAKWGEKAAAILKKQADGDKRLFKDGSTMVDSGFAGFIDGAVYIHASSSEKQKPGVVQKVDGALHHIKDENDFYSGCKAIASISAYAWEHAIGGKGVSLSLNNIQKIADGERLGGGRSSPEQDFEAPMASEGLEDFL
jgi:hypothetical protein